MTLYNSKNPISHLTQSQYYSAAFNAAIFDGPLRIYFAQYQEPIALKIYFRLLESLKDTLQLARESMRQQGQNVFVMLYPNAEIFAQSFPRFAQERWAEEVLGTDRVLGLNGPVLDEQVESILPFLELRLKSALAASGVGANPVPVPSFAEATL